MPAFGKLRQYFFAITAVGAQDRADFAVVREGLQSAFGHRVHRERRCQSLDVQNVGGFGILGSRAGPEQTLRTGSEIVDALPAWRVEQRSRYAL